MWELTVLFLDSSIIKSCICFFFLSLFIYFERDRESASGEGAERERQREGERESQAGSMQSVHRARCRAQTHETVRS